MKIITFALASVSFVLSRATAAVAIAPDHVTDDIVEELDALEELDDVSADMVPDVPDGTVYKINFDDIDAGDGFSHEYERHDMSGVHFTKTDVMNANVYGSEVPDSWGWSSAASSPPNVAVPSSSRVKVHCYGGFLDMKSMKVMPVSFVRNLKPIKIKIRGIRNGKTVARDKYTLDIKTMTEPFTFKFGKKYNKVSEVVVSLVDKKDFGSRVFALDDLEFKVVKECKPEPTSDFRVSFDGVRTGKMSYVGAFKKHIRSGVEFVNIEAVNAQKTMRDTVGYDLVPSPPNYANRIDEDTPAQLICPNGFLAMKSVQLMGSFTRDIEVAIEGYDENNNVVASVKHVLSPSTYYDGPFFEFSFDEDFDKVRKVTFEAETYYLDDFGIDDIKYKVIEKC